jgi:tetratricopeptide (TPR) repeat protein
MVKSVFAILVLCAPAVFSQDVVLSRASERTAAPSSEQVLSRTSLDGRRGNAANSQAPIKDGSDRNQPADSAEIQVSVTGTDNLINTLQAQAQKSPNDPARYDQLGAAYFQKARETGDVAYYDLAEKTLNRFLELSANNFEAADPLAHIASVYMGEHRFTEALATAHKAMGIGAGNLAAFAVEGDAYTDMGEYQSAANAYQALGNIGAVIASPLRVTYLADSRIAYLKFLNGDTAESMRLMKQSIMAALQMNVPPENLAWLYYELGERCFQAGDLEDADRSYRSALNVDAHHFRSLAGLAKVRAAQGRFDDSIKLYEASITLVPLPQYIADLGDVYLKIGKRAQAQEQYDLVEYIGYLSKLNQVLNNRELAMFYADREIKLPQALQLAKAEFDVRHDIYTWDTVAWVLYKNQRFPEAAQAMEEALCLHTNDSILLFHAGMIEHALGNDEAAQNDLDRALKINPHFHVFYAERARRMLDEIARSRQVRASHETR